MKYIKIYICIIMLFVITFNITTVYGVTKREYAVEMMEKADALNEDPDASDADKAEANRVASLSCASYLNDRTCGENGDTQMYTAYVEKYKKAESSGVVDDSAIEAIEAEREAEAQAQIAAAPNLGSTQAEVAQASATASASAAAASASASAAAEAIRYADAVATAGRTLTGAEFLNNMLGLAASFVTGGSDVANMGTNIASLITATFVPMIEAIGILVLFTVAAVLGVQYIWSGVDGKSKVKETLPTFAVGAAFFFLSTNIYKFASTTIKALVTGTNFTTMQGTIWGTVSLVVNLLALTGVFAIGIKYMFASANEKADIKTAMTPVVIGLIFVYATSSALGFLVNSVGGIIKP